MTMGKHEKYYTVAEVAARFRVSKKTIYRACRNGQIRYIKVGDSYRIPESAIEKLEKETGMSDLMHPIDRPDVQPVPPEKENP